MEVRSFMKGNKGPGKEEYLIPCILLMTRHMKRRQKDKKREK